MKSTADRKAACHHCGLPVPVHATSEEGHPLPVFCCFGCRLVWEVESHSDTGSEESEGTLSPIKKLYLRFALAVIASMFLVFISLTLHFEADQAPDFLYAVSLALATGVMFLLSGPFLDNLKREIADRQLSLATLIFVGSGAAYILSAWSTLARIPGLSESAYFLSGQPTYFETSAMILTFYVGSLLLDARMKQGMAAYARLWQVERAPEVLKAEDREALSLLLSGKKAPDEATIRKKCGIRRLEADKLVKGDLIFMNQGEPAFIDGEVVYGNGLVDESHLTGEPAAVRKNRGHTITAGSISIDGGLIVKVLQTYQNSSMNTYIKKARALRSRPGYYERFAARAARFLLIFVVCAAFGGLIYHTVNGHFSTALPIFLSVLLIGCPCAFSISTPAALWVANQRLHRAGIVAMGGSRALEKLSAIRSVLFDKTGTLTEGVAIQSISMENESTDQLEKLMRMAGGLEMDQEHPFARAVRRYLDQHGLEPVWPDDTGLLPGKGMYGLFKSEEGLPQNVCLANHTHELSQGKLNDQEIGLFVDDVLMLRFRLFQPPKQHLEAVIEALQKENGVHVAVVTGDPARSSEALPLSVLSAEFY
ncbi:HAD-IC family P-type ATPase, partial [Balneolaceae bacterium ANBcel3]|nr:HAD-IC family P-type ATPase [Balneolaceae bacterium ANBcel3]